MEIARGFAPIDRPAVAALYWEAFGAKLGRALGPHEAAADLSGQRRHFHQRIPERPAQGVPRVAVGGLHVRALHLVHDRLHRLVHKNE